MKQPLTKEKILLSWSGGKDSALSFHEIQKAGQYQIAALLTTITEGYDRISMHGVRRDLLEFQAEALGVDLCKVYIPKGCVNERYEALMRETMEHYYSQGIRSVAFGDLFLEDIRHYRKENLAKVQMQGIFPLWRQPTPELARTFVDLGFKAVICCVDPKKLDPSFAGKVIDHNFLDTLPRNVDPCGENGEFHSFVFAGPIFKNEIQISIGAKIERDGFWFCDIVPADKAINKN